MASGKTNKRKIVNDPVSGFIDIDSELIFDLIEHKYFQRLRRIRQLGLSSMVYPGANHTRFEHGLGAFQLMRLAIDVLKSKGISISNEESEAVCVAILLHDIGHGPFSHALENALISGITHESLSLYVMNQLNNEFDGKLTLAIQIFKNEYAKKFLHQLVSSQLDMDRLDYLRRDSFYSGVTEGVISSDRIIKMLHVKNDELVVEAKGIYSIEKFLIARRLMYWQVYLHKTVISAEFILVNVLKRAKELVLAGVEVFASPTLQLFLSQSINQDSFADNNNQLFILDQFCSLDDSDILSALKVWRSHPDRILAFLSSAIVDRRLLKIKIRNSAISEKEAKKVEKTAMKHFAFNSEEIKYIVFTGSIFNFAYEPANNNINILFKNGKIADINEASDINLEALTKTVRKHFLCYPKEL